MAEAQNVPASGFNVPPVPASASQSGGNVPPTADQMQPGFVNPNPAPAGITPEQVQAQIAAALAAAKPPTPVAPAATTPPIAISKGDASDPLLTSLTDVFLSVGQGIDMERAIGKALTYGDAALIDLAYIQEKGGANATQLSTLASAIVQRVQTQAAESTNAVYQTAGDKAQWDAAAAVFNTQAPQHLKMVISQMLDSGNTEAIKAAAKSVVEYVKQNGLVVNPAQMIHAGASSAGAAQALSKAQFQEAMFKLDQNSRTYSQDRADLFARRQLGKQLGV